LWAFLFSLANSEPVTLDLVFARLEPAALSVWLIAAFVAGGCAGCSRAAWRSGVRSVPSRARGAYPRRRRSWRHPRAQLRQRAEHGVSIHHRRWRGDAGGVSEVSHAISIRLP
jgi:hypothetical protein